MTSDPLSSDFHYKEYSLQQLDNWVNDALNCDDLSPQDIYDTIVKCVDESVEYHKKYLDKSIKLLSLLKGHREIDLEDVMKEREYYEGGDYTATGEKFPRSCDGDDSSPECKKNWVDFWEETYYPEEHKQYTEEELNAMCDKAASDQEKDKCREYNLREAEYYDKRAKLDAEYTHAKIQANSPYNDGWTQQHYQKIADEIKAAGGYEWTPNSTKQESEHSKYYYDFDRNKPIQNIFSDGSGRHWEIKS